MLKGGEKPPSDDALPGGQEHLPGMAPMPKNNRIHNLARRVKKASKEWSAAAKEHKGLKEQLTEMMIEEGTDYYAHGDVEVHLDTRRKLTVKVENDKEEE